MAVTHLGAHMAPVLFDVDKTNVIQPYAISPWQGETEGLPSEGSELPLRGDFFCLPFGKGEAPDGEIHPPHGATSSEIWTFVDERTVEGRHCLTLQMETPVRPGRVTKTYELHDGENAVYETTSIEGFAGPATIGHHAVLALPEKEGALLVSSSAIRAGMTYPRPFGCPAEGSYQSLAIGRRFHSLRRIPSIFRGTASLDCTAYPARRGYSDLLQIAQRPKLRGPCWVTAVNTDAGYLWFALKDISVLPSTLFWIENRGRHRLPWSGRTISLGLEDVCSYFDLGITESMAPNEFQKRGVPTFHHLTGRTPFVVRYIQGAVAIPAGFSSVKEVLFLKNEVVFIDGNGKRFGAPLRHDFIMRSHENL